MPYMPLNALQFDDVDRVFPVREMPLVITALAKGEVVSSPRMPVQRR